MTGADAALFSLDASAGAVSFITAPDFETPGDADGDNIYDVTVTASDGELSSSQDIAITVTDVNEAPVFSTAENFTNDEGDQFVAFVTAADDEGETITYSIIGGDDQDDFTIVSETGELTLNDTRFSGTPK